MKNNKVKNKIFSAIAVLAVSATALCGAISISACGDKYISDGDSAVTVVGNKTKISTASGTVYSENTGNVYYVSNQPAAEPAVNDSTKPYDLHTLLSSDSILQPGDTVLVKPGKYEISITLGIHASGSYNKYIKIFNAAYVEDSGYTGAEKEVVLDFSAQAFDSTKRGVQIYGNYIYWHGIDICGAGDNGMYIGGSYNTIEYSEFYNNRDTGLQLGRSYSDTTDSKYNHIDNWPSYNLIKNCTSHNNYDNESYGENADGFAAKLTVGYGNVFDGCIAYRNSDDGWDLYAKTDSGNIGTVVMYNCVAFENGYLEYTQQECNRKFPSWNGSVTEAGKKPDGTPYTSADAEFYGKDSYMTRDGDGNGFKLGGSVMEGDVIMYNCLSFNNRMHGVTDNSNPGVLSLNGITSYNNSAAISNTRYIQKSQAVVDKDGNHLDADGKVTTDSSKYAYEMVDTDQLNPYFGQVMDVANSDGHGNIDVSRQKYSYNNLNRILSVGDGYAKSLSNDAYRGSVSDSYLYAGSDSYHVSGSIDADSKGGISGTKGAKLVSTDVFVKLPFTKAESEYTRNISGLTNLYVVNGETVTLNANRIHLAYRNAGDHSINMHDILAKKAGVDDTLLLTGKDLGATLNKTSWGDYKHFYNDEFVNANAASLDKSKVERALEALNLNCDPANVYQDFDVPSKMIDCTLTWESSDTNVLVVGTDKNTSVSKSEYIDIIVYRDPTEVKTVKLTATATCNDATDKREFTVVVIPGAPVIGNIFVTAKDGTVVENGGSLIIDRYSIFSEPVLSVENGLDYNGKLLPESIYNVTTKYEYQTDSLADKVEVKGYTPSTSGVYTITKTVTIKSDTSKKATMSYKVFTASMDANVRFVGNSAISVNRSGYLISGTLSSATGYLYAVSSAEAIDFTKEGVDILTTEGVTVVPFRGETISMQFENVNNAAYHIYYALTNLNGKVTSEVYHEQVGVTDIATTDDFIKVAGGNPVGSENMSKTIYRLSKDLDFNGVTYTVGSKAFTGVINGMGHAVKNITITSTATKGNVGVFYKVNGGTIENIKFDNISITVNAEANKVGLVSECTGGYFYNIALTNIAVSSKGQRVGGLIGGVGTGAPIYIDQVSLINDKDHIITGGQRVGGFVGFSQSTNDPGSIEFYISNCYVNAHIVAPFELGGFIGTYDCGNNAAIYYNLEMTSCVFAGTVTSTGTKSYAGGMVGYQKGNHAQMTITKCISIGTIEFAGVELTAALKNASAVIGSYVITSTLAEGITARVDSCLALYEDYNTDFDVVASDTLAVASQFVNRLDSAYWTIVYREGSTDLVEAPYATLNFLGDWN